MLYIQANWAGCGCVCCRSMEAEDGNSLKPEMNSAAKYHLLDFPYIFFIDIFFPMTPAHSSFLHNTWVLWRDKWFIVIQRLLMYDVKLDGLFSKCFILGKSKMNAFFSLETWPVCSLFSGMLAVRISCLIHKHLLT